MPDEPTAVPDFLPASIEDEHVEAAREQVHQSHALQPTPPALRPDDAAVRPHSAADESSGPPRACRWLAELSGEEIGLATAATVVGLMGATALTIFWTWLAMTEDPMWWWFTWVGSGLILASTITTVALNQHGRKLAAATVPSSDTRPDRALGRG